MPVASPTLGGKRSGFALLGFRRRHERRGDRVCLRAIECHANSLGKVCLAYFACADVLRKAGCLGLLSREKALLFFRDLIELAKRFCAKLGHSQHYK